MLEIDHLFCFVDPLVHVGPHEAIHVGVDGSADWASRARSAGWILDEGVDHQGQGTHNRRLWLREQYLEFIWLSSRTDAAKHPLRLDRRADWRTTGACPFGIGLRGQLDEDLRSEFWAYHPPYARDACLWVHRAHEAAPLVFVIEGSAEVVDGLRPRIRLADRPHLLAHSRSATIHRVGLRTPGPVQALLANVTPRIASQIGNPPQLEIILSDASSPVLKLTEELSLIG